MNNRQLRQQTAVYTHAFQTFLVHTDEKRVLLEQLKWRIPNRAISLLDVGAGNGDLAIPLSKLVDRYVAFEQKENYVLMLRQAGLQVADEIFPHSLPWYFNLVLLSHSLPWKQVEYEPFVEQAWLLVKPGGKLLIITYDDEKGDWNGLLDVCDLKGNRVQRQRLERLMFLLEGFGPLTKSSVTTHVRTHTLDEMMRALAFVYSDGDPEKIDRFVDNTRAQHLIEDRRGLEESYSFPFDYIFLEVQK